MMAAGAWSQTASILAMTANINRDTKKKKEPYLPDEFNHYAAKKAPEKPIKVPLSVVRDMVVRAGNGR